MDDKDNKPEEEGHGQDQEKSQNGTTTKVEVEEVPEKMAESPLPADASTETETTDNKNDADEAAAIKEDVQEVVQVQNEIAGAGALDDPAKQTFITDLSSICDVDNKTAERMLIEHNWNMQNAIDKFLNESRDEEVMIVDQVQEHSDQTYAEAGSSRNHPASSPQMVDLTEDVTSPEIKKEMNVEKETSIPVVIASPSSLKDPTEFSTWAPEKLSIMSWNLDGLDEKNLEKRTEAVLQQILRENHAIIFFQELIPQTFDYLARNLNSRYLPIPGTEDSSTVYLTGTFLKRNHVIYEDHYILPFPGTAMGRNVLVTRAFVGRAKLFLLNTHLESTAEFTKERQTQLKFCFDQCAEYPKEYNVIFGGDLNLRDKEVIGIAPNMVDLWIQCGARETCKYTWDLTRNTNKQMPSRFQPRLRFDRLYFRPSEPQTLIPEFFGVTGIEKVAGTQSFPSDHWAIMSFFGLTKEARKPLPKKRKADDLETNEVEYVSA